MTNRTLNTDQRQSTSSETIVSASHSSPLSSSSSSSSASSQQSPSNRQNNNSHNSHNDNSVQINLQQSHRRISKRKTVQNALSKTFVTIMNAAVTIFGVGVGVGLILGDSFRERSRNRERGGNNGSNVSGSATVNGGISTSDMERNQGGYDTSRRGHDEGLDGFRNGRNRDVDYGGLLPAQ